MTLNLSDFAKFGSLLDHSRQYIDHWSRAELRVDNYLLLESQEAEHLQDDLNRGKPLEFEGETVSGNQHVGVTYLQQPGTSPPLLVPNLPEKLPNLGPLPKIPIPPGVPAIPNIPGNVGDVLNGSIPLPQAPSLPALPNVKDLTAGATIPTLPPNPLQNGLPIPSGIPQLPVPNLPNLPKLPNIPKLPGLPSKLPSFLPGGGGNLPKLPSTATLWTLFRKPHAGFNSAFSASDGLFKGIDTEGYLDINPRLGVDYAVHAVPGGLISGEVQVDSRLPFVDPPSNSPQITHTVVLDGAWESYFKAPAVGITKHKTSVKVPLAGKSKSHAKLELRKRRKSPGTEVKLEIGPRGAIKDDSGHSTIGPKSKNNMSRDPRLTAQLHQSDDEEEEDHEDMRTQHNPAVPLQMPVVSIEILPNIPSSSSSSSYLSKGEERENGGVVVEESNNPQPFLNFQWRQAWLPTLRSNVAFRGRSSQQLSLDVRAQPMTGLQLGGCAAVSFPLDAATQSSTLTARVRYNFKTTEGRRYTLQAQSSVSTTGKSGGPKHVLKFRHVYPKSQVKAGFQLQLNPGSPDKKYSLKYDVSIPSL